MAVCCSAHATETVSLSLRLVLVLYCTRRGIVLSTPRLLAPTTNQACKRIVTGHSSFVVLVRLMFYNAKLLRTSQSND
jgi:hypothetical protein